MVASCSWAGSRIRLSDDPAIACYADGMLSIAPAQCHEREAAFRLAFQHLTFAEQTEKFHAANEMIQTGELSPDSVWLARDSIGLAGAMIVAPVPGGGAAVYPPQGRPSLHRPNEVLDPLVNAATAWLKQCGIRLAQTLLSSSEKKLAVPLERNGFAHITTLHYLRHFLDLSAEEIARNEKLEYRSVIDLPSNVVENVLLRTYVDSLDCPEVNLHRSAAQALAGHRGNSVLFTKNWWVAFADNEPVAVLLCNDMDDNTWDIAYLGVVSEARQQGFGRDLVQHALFEAKADDMLTVTLTVDERNTPARKLYRKMGFEPFDEKVVYLWTASA